MERGRALGESFNPSNLPQRTSRRTSTEIWPPFPGAWMLALYSARVLLRFLLPAQRRARIHKFASRRRKQLADAFPVLAYVVL